MSRPIATCALVALLSCRGGDTEPGYYGNLGRHGRAPTELTVCLHDEPEFIDPGLGSEQVGSVLAADLFDGLVVKHPRDSHPVPGVATRYDKNDDNRVYRFHLRRDARWSDGRPVTAGDFVYAWRRVLTASTGARMVTNLYVIKNGEGYHTGRIKVLTEDAPALGLSKGEPVRLLAAPDKAKDGKVEVEPATLPRYGVPSSGPIMVRRAAVKLSLLRDDPSVIGVRAVDDHTLEVELEQPTPYFLDLLAMSTYAPVPRFTVERHGERWTRPENIVVNGPYTLAEHQFRYQLVLERNPHHDRYAQLKLHRVTYLLVSDYHAVLALYKTGEVDWIGATLSLPQAQLELLKQTKDFSVAPYVSTYWYEINTRRPPVDDVRVRKALNLAIDKRALVERIARGGQPPATHYVPESVGFGYADAFAGGRKRFSGAGYDFDPARARALLAEAGYRVEKRDGGYHAAGFPALEILYNTSEGHRNLAVAIQAMWKQHLGVSASLRNEEWKVMLKNLRDGHFQVARFGWSADYNHPHTFLETFLSYSPNNWTRHEDKELDALVKLAAATPDPALSMARYLEAEQRLVDAMPRIPLYFYTKGTLAKPYLKGLWGNGLNDHPVRFMWIDPEWRKHPDQSPAYDPGELPPPGKL